MQEKWLIRSDALKILPVHPSYLAELARSGKIRAERGERGWWMYNKADLQKYAQQEYRFKPATRAGRGWSEKELVELHKTGTVQGRSKSAVKVQKSRLKGGEKHH